MDFITESYLSNKYLKFFQMEVLTLTTFLPFTVLISRKLFFLATLDNVVS